MLHKEFFSGRVVPDLHPQSQSYIDWWAEQVKRCKEGFEYNGTRVTGDYYFFLNFFKMLVVSGGNFVLSYPFYCSVDKEIFDNIELAFINNQGILIVTHRGAGKSYIVTSICVSKYTLYPNSYSVISASIEKFAGELFSKARIALDNIHPVLFHNRDRADKSDLLHSGTKIKDDLGQLKYEGFSSKIEKFVYGHDEGVTRGKRPQVHIFEEVGSWSGSAKLIDCYNASKASWRVGSQWLCTPILIGTGGQMKSGASQDAKKMFYNPEDYNLLSFDTGNGNKTSYFIPSFKKLGGFYEKEGPVIIKGEQWGFVKEQGVPDQIGAKAYEEELRKKESRNIISYEQHIQEFPFTPEEAFLVSSHTPFSEFLRDRYYQVSVDRSLQKVVKRGHLVMTGKKDADGLPEIEFIKKKDGPFQIIEEPQKQANGFRYNNLYLSGCDSYDAASAETSESQGSIFIYKRELVNDSFTNCFVAQYTGRPNDPRDFYRATQLLNLWYGSKMLFEHSNLRIMEYYIQSGYDWLLYEKPQVAYSFIKNSKSNNKYGLQMNDKTKAYCVEAYMTYCREYAQNFIFEDQLKDNIEFNLNENRFDRTMASMLAIVADNDMYDKLVKGTEEKKPLNLPKYRRVNGELVFS